MLFLLLTFFLVSDLYASQSSSAQPVQSRIILQADDVDGLKKAMLSLDEDDQKAYHQTVLNRSTDLTAAKAIFSDPDLAHPPASSFIPKTLLDMSVQAESDQYFYMSTSKHIPEFSSEIHPARYFVATLLSGHMKTDYYSRFFVPFFLAEYIIPDWRRSRPLSDSQLKFIRTITPHCSAHFSGYMQNLFWVLFMIQGSITSGDDELGRNIKDFLVEKMGFEWISLFEVYPRTATYRLRHKLYCPMANAIRIAHHWGLDVSEICRKYPQDASVIEYNKSPADFVDNEITAEL